MEQKKSSVMRRETLLMILCAGLYTLAYLGKYSFTCNKTAIKDFFAITQDALIGLPGTLFFFAYGVGQVINGIFCKYYNKKVILSLSLLVSAGINFAIFLGIDFAYIPYLWLVNGFAQSFLWSSL
ncbi:MAG: hypothetical protein J6Y43_08525, partial [Clostridia bacterium]|nr:hypothetical protein [Clostridia bacterium]